MFGKLISAALLALTLFTPVHSKPFQHPFGELREYHRHWIAICPNEKNAQSASFYKRTCWATTYSGDENGNISGAFPGHRLSLQKDRFTGAFAINFVAKTEDTYAMGESVRFKFSSGKTVELTFGKQVVKNGNTINEFTINDRVIAYDLIQRMRYASHMLITLPGKKGPHEIQFSMIGLRKAMAFISINGRRTTPD